VPPLSEIFEKIPYSAASLYASIGGQVQIR